MKIYCSKTENFPNQNERNSKIMFLLSLVRGISEDSNINIPPFTTLTLLPHLVLVLALWEVEIGPTTPAAFPSPILYWFASLSLSLSHSFVCRILDFTHVALNFCKIRSRVHIFFTYLYRLPLITPEKIIKPPETLLPLSSISHSMIGAGYQLPIFLLF